MDYIENFQNSIDYIEEHIKEKLTVEELAKLSGFSTYHYYRLFNAYIGMPVMEYIRRRRMAFAVSELSMGKRIIDIALDYGFDTHNGFSKAFRREYGYSPEQYRMHVNGHLPEKLDLKTLIGYNLKGGVLMEPKIVGKPAFKIVGYALNTTTEGNRNKREIPAFWDRFEIDGIEEKLYEQLSPSEHGEYGVCFPHDTETGNFTYVIGVKVDNYDKASEDMFKGEIPESTYAVFTTPPADYAEKGFVKAIEGTWKYIFEKWFPNSGYEFAPDKVDFEFYDERCHDYKGAVMDIYIPIVKK